jgi:hypothetical protein
MKQKVETSRFLVNKVIYAKRVATTKEQINSIMNLEIETHLRNNSDLQFKGFGKVVENDDRSKTFPLVFEPKATQAKPVE